MKKLRHGSRRALRNGRFGRNFARQALAAILIDLASMGRERRPNIPGAMYHVMNRGNRKALIFEDDRDRRQFQRIFAEEQEVFGVRTLGGVLMGNHFHSAVLTPHGNLSEFMQRMEGRFAKYSNRRHGRVGHLFQGRFRHVLIEHDTHLLTALCYIFMNPVVAGLASALEQYKWSTYAFSAGFSAPPAYLSLEWLEILFPAASLPLAQQHFRRIMGSVNPVAAYLDDRELNVSADTIHQVLRSYTGEQLQIASLPRVYRTALRPPIETLLTEAGGDRCRFIREARVVYGYRNGEIAKVLGIKPATVSKIFCDCRRQLT